MAECYFDRADSLLESLQEAFDKSEMIIVVVDRNASTYGPIYGFERKLKNVEMKELAERQAAMFKHKDKL